MAKVLNRWLTKKPQYRHSDSDKTHRDRSGLTQYRKMIEKNKQDQKEFEGKVIIKPFIDAMEEVVPYNKTKGGLNDRQENF